MRTDTELLRLLWSHTEISAGCWLWKRSLNTWGYGQAWVGVGHSLLPCRTQVHIISHYLFTGQHGGKDSAIHHTCGNRPCWNPAHLQAMTQREHGLLHNGSDTCPRGHRDFYISPSDGNRTCRVCNREFSKKSRAKKRAAA